LAGSLAVEPEPDQVAAGQFREGHDIDVVVRPQALPVGRRQGRRLLGGVAASLQEQALHAEGLQALDDWVEATAVQGAGEVVGDLRGLEGSGRGMLVAPAVRLGGAELGVHPEDLVEAPQVPERVVAGVVQDESVQPLRREQLTPGPQAAEVFAAGDDVRHGLARLAEREAGRDVALAPQVQVPRPGTVKGVAERDDHRRLREHLVQPPRHQRMGQVG
jgi:hypothetical protein